MEFFEEVELAERELPAAVRPAPLPLSPVSPALQLETEPLSGLFGSLPLVASEVGMEQGIDAFEAGQQEAAEAGTLWLDSVLAAAATRRLPEVTATAGDDAGDAILVAPVPFDAACAASEHPLPAADDVQIEPAAAPLPRDTLSADAEGMPAGAYGIHEASTEHAVVGDAGAAGPLDGTTTGASAGLGYTACWRRVLKAHETAMRVERECCSDTDTVFGSSIGVTEPRGLDKVRQDLMLLLIAKAAHAFAVPGVRLNIDRSEVQEALTTKANYHPEHAERASWHYMTREERQAKKWLSEEEIQAQLCAEFDPDAVWTYLQDKYGGPAGERLAHQQVAAALFSALRLRDHAPEEKKGRLLVSSSAWSEAGFRSTRRRYSHTTIMDLRKLRHNLAVFAKWAGDMATANAVEHGHCPTLENHGELVSRSKASFGAIQWVFFNSCVEIYFSAELGMKFRMFMAEFGPRPDAA